MFPFAINNTLKFLSHTSESFDDDMIKDRINQTIFQALGPKKNVKINAIVVIECDNEPKRTLVINESSNGNININPNIHIAAKLPNNAFASISTNSVQNHTGVLLQQPPLFSTTIEDLQALFNITPSNPPRQNVSVSEILPQNQMNFSFISTQNCSPESISKIDKPGDNNEFALSSRKRKSEKPMKIPQDSPLDSNGLDLTINVKQERIVVNDTESKMERFFNCNLPIWPCSTTADMKPYITQAPLIISKPKKLQSMTGHKKSSKVFNCNQCKLQFNSLNALCKHTFSDHRAFRCTFCSANFTQRSNLQRHSLKHVGFKPFICNVCGKAYYRKDHLVRHIEVSHPGSDPKSNITVKLSSSECLEYLERMQNNRLIEMENAEDGKEVMEQLGLEPIGKTSPFVIHLPDIENSPYNDDGMEINSQSDNGKFISIVKEEIESPGRLQIALDENSIPNRENVNGIMKIEEEMMPTDFSGSNSLTYIENCQEQILKNCI